jgi:hypothetical protein
MTDINLEKKVQQQQEELNKLRFTVAILERKIILLTINHHHLDEKTIYINSDIKKIERNIK